MNIDEWKMRARFLLSDIRARAEVADTDEKKAAVLSSALAFAALDYSNICENAPSPTDPELLVARNDLNTAAMDFACFEMGRSLAEDLAQVRAQNAGPRRGFRTKRAQSIRGSRR